MKTLRKLYPSLFLLAMLLLLEINCVKAQDDEEVTWRDRVFFGGNLSLSVGSVTAIEVNPLIGYRLTPRWSAGLGLDYEYYKSSGTYFGANYAGPYSTQIYGGNIFTSFVFLKNFPTEGISLFAHAESETLSLERKYFQDYNGTGRFMLNSFFAGLGVRQRTGRRSSFNVLFLWNFNETQYSPYYGNPVIKFNFIF